MQVSWATWCASPATVQYGTSKGALSLTATGKTTSYTQQGGYVSPTLLHTVLPKLQPATVYYYTVGDDTTIRSFKSHPGVGAAAASPMTFAVMGDLGQTTNSWGTVAHIEANPDIDSICAWWWWWWGVSERVLR